ncbi:hypothetical protein L6E12_07955 [Actinokineospora sp. PR83]|uniref:hypothetical protein n=1 Tax=Actinokineospora sp. PR83 TaxID=2884908 RepID=UPI001F297B03|nr:hypothetical protein [Actinokineospora sp. PR83]MCG8915719.1 hypothetical protein [Actinokineospora sp. PR83]
MSEHYTHPSAADPGPRVENVASDHARVEQQIGAIHGDPVFRNESTYNINTDDPPERKEEVALNFLRGGIPRQAEQVLHGLIYSGQATTKRLYHYVLAVLSERSLAEIDERVFTNLRDAFRISADFPPDTWRTALDVVDKLVIAAQKQEDDVFDVTEPEAVRRFDDLPAARRAEINRHLGLILTGVRDERLRSATIQRISAERLGAGRIERAWKFFQADPAPPRPATAGRVPLAEDNRQRLLIGGGAVVVGVAAGLAALGTGNIALVVLGLFLALSGGYAAVRFGGEREAERLRIRQLRARHAHPTVPKRPVSPGHWVSTAFVQEVHSRVEARFQHERPHEPGDWRGDTQGYRDHLKDRLVWLYGNAQVKPAEIDWLMRWHAKRVRDEWRSGALAAKRHGQESAVASPPALAAGIAAAVVGVALLVAGGGAVAAVLLAGGAFYAGRAAWESVGARLRQRTEQVEEDTLFRAEQRGHQEWIELMADRPTDDEMGRWLELDRMFLWMWVVEMYRLSPHDVIANVILTEGAPKAARARVSGGPPRFSRYQVTIFLLTGNGVRQVSVDLDFLQGGYGNERRRAYRYDVLGSAAIVEAGPRSKTDQKGASVMGGRKFTLSLLDQNSVEVVVRDFDDIIDFEREDGDRLMRMALETSGIAHALHVLEAVTAEGSTWLTRERERTRRRSRDWFGDDGAAAPDITHLFSENRAVEARPARPQFD